MCIYSESCTVALSIQDGRIMQMSMSTHYIACAMASGVVQVLNISSPEQVIALTCPDTAVNLAAVSCVFSSDGSQLAALFSNGRLCAWDCTLLDQVYLTFRQVWSTAFHDCNGCEGF